MPSRRSTNGFPVAIEGYDVLDEIGAGGFSVVYRARQSSMNRDVAIKVLNAGFSSDAERRTFERECHALGQLSHHPNIVTVFNDTFTTDGRPCIVMELYHSNYRERLEQSGPLAVDEALAVTVRICGALADRARGRRAASRPEAAQHLRVGLRRAGARRLRHLDDRRRAYPEPVERSVDRLRRARGARGRRRLGGLRRLFDGDHAVPVDRRHDAVRRARTWRRRCAASSPRRRRGSTDPACRPD